VIEDESEQPTAIIHTVTPPINKERAISHSW